MLLSIIVVSYNTKELTLQTLQSVVTDVERSSLLKGQTEIWVVDNHSSDDSVAHIKKFAATSAIPIQLLENSENVGFGRANNLALEQATGKYFLLLNSDTIVKVGALEIMVKTFEKTPMDESTAVLSSEHGKLDRLGVLSPLLLQADGQPQLQGGALPSLGTLTAHWLLFDDIPFLGSLLPSTQQKSLGQGKEELHQVGWVPGTAMMIRREVIEEIGPLDQNIFMYGEDMEFCVRAQDHHWDVAIQPKAQITHLGSASSSSSNAILGEIKGYIYIWAKHKPLWQRPILYFILRLGCMLRQFLFGTMLRQPKRAHIYAQGMREVLE